MKKRCFVALLVVATLLPASAAFAWRSATTWGNGKTTSTSSQVTANGNGTVTRNSTATGPNGQTAVRTATRGNGMATVTRANGSTRTTVRSR